MFSEVVKQRHEPASTLAARGTRPSPNRVPDDWPRREASLTEAKPRQ